MIRNRENQEPRGFGFVTFTQPAAAVAAMAANNGKVLGGIFGDRPIKVAPSQKPPRI